MMVPRLKHAAARLHELLERFPPVLVYLPRTVHVGQIDHVVLQERDHSQISEGLGFVALALQPSHQSLHARALAPRCHLVEHADLERGGLRSKNAR